MRLEEQLNQARRAFHEGVGSEWFDGLADAILMAAGGDPSIYNARRVIREHLAEDADWRRAYVANIACKIMDFEKARHAEPGTQVGPLTAAQRDRLAGEILDLIFGE